MRGVYERSAWEECMTYLLVDYNLPVLKGGKHEVTPDLWKGVWKGGWKGVVDYDLYI
jgi:hypothetical protein